MKIPVLTEKDIIDLTMLGFGDILCAQDYTYFTSQTYQLHVIANWNPEEHIYPIIITTASNPQEWIDIAHSVKELIHKYKQGFNNAAKHYTGNTDKHEYFLKQSVEYRRENNIKVSGLLRP